MKALLNSLALAFVLTAPGASYAGNPARDLTGAIYGAAGQRACGAACRAAATEAGKRVFDANSWITDRVGEAGAELGTKIRSKVCSKRKC